MYDDDSIKYARRGLLQFQVFCLLMEQCDINPKQAEKVKTYITIPRTAT